MKVFITLLMLAASYAHADVPTIKAKSVTCQELKDAFSSYKSVNVIYGILGVSRATFWESKDDARANCLSNTRVIAKSFRTSDGVCKVGFGCEPIRENPCHGRGCLN